jgi:hypothetical protein
MSDKGRPERRADGADQFWIEREGSTEHFMMGDDGLYYGISITPAKARQMAALLLEYAEGHTSMLVLTLDEG